METGNLFQEIPRLLPEELTEILLTGKGAFRVERIVSRGHASPEDFWYEQEENEWVTLLSGNAQLLFGAVGGVEGQSIQMKSGDWLMIPAGVRHRVESTDLAVESVWLAIFWS